MTDTLNRPAREVQPGWEVYEQGDWLPVVQRTERGDLVALALGNETNTYPYHVNEVLTVRVPVHRFIVEVDGCSAMDAARVMAERLNHDEDYGFPYGLTWAVTS